MSRGSICTTFKLIPCISCIPCTEVSVCCTGYTGYDLDMYLWDPQTRASYGRVEDH